MKRILAFAGSPRARGNSTILLENLMRGAQQNGAPCEVIDPQAIAVDHCRGCLRCNVLKRCSLNNDDWGVLSTKILESDIVVFASPVYFHHLSASLKKIIERFRSFLHVQITPDGLQHTPWQEWKKDFVLILTMGSSDDRDARPVIDLFTYMTEILGPENRLHVVTGTRLAAARQVERNADELSGLYKKLGLPSHLAGKDHHANQNLMQRCYELGCSLTE